MNNIIEITEDNFLTEVVEKSKNLPVLVDFWAPWCGPCKQLTPILENTIKNKGGKILLAKINVDENPNIASQFKIQSIPTVYGFVDGRPVDAFQGLQPQSKIEDMINKLIDAMPGNEVPKLIEEAQRLFKNQKFQEAQMIYEKLTTIEPGEPKIISGIIRCLIQLNNLTEAQNILDSVDDKILADTEIQKIIVILKELNRPVDKNKFDNILGKLKVDPLNKKLRYKLAELYLSSNDIKNGLEELLKIFDQDPQWNDSAAKNKLLEQFDLLGFNDPNVIEARKKLSSLMFK